MKESYTSKRRVRKNFGRIDAVADMPSLIEVQTGSYNNFIKLDSATIPLAQAKPRPQKVYTNLFFVKINKTLPNHKIGIPLADKASK